MEGGQILPRQKPEAAILAWLLPGIQSACTVDDQAAIGGEAVAGQKLRILTG